MVGYWHILQIHAGGWLDFSPPSMERARYDKNSKTSKECDKLQV